MGRYSEIPPREINRYIRTKTCCHVVEASVGAQNFFAARSVTCTPRRRSPPVSSNMRMARKTTICGSTPEACVATHQAHMIASEVTDCNGCGCERRRLKVPTWLLASAEAVYGGIWWDVAGYGEI